MGLFSKKIEVPTKKDEISPRDFEFSRGKLEKNLNRLAGYIFDGRDTESQINVLELVETIRSLELLNLGSPRDGAMETYHYNRGRLDALSNLLQVRDTMIAEVKKKNESERKKTKPKNAKASSYVSGRAALSI